MAQTQNQKNNTQKNPPLPKVNPNAETVMILDMHKKNVKIIGTIDEKTHRHSEVTPEKANAHAFYEVKNSNILANFLFNFRQAWKDSWQNYKRNHPEDTSEMPRVRTLVLPISKVAEVTSAAYDLMNGVDNKEGKKLIERYSNNSFDLDNIKYERGQIPFDTILAGGVSEEMLEKNNLIRELMKGRTTSQNFYMHLNTPDGGEAEGDYAIKVKSTPDGDLKVRFIAPLSRPEYLDEKYHLTKEEQIQLERGQTLDHQLLLPHEETGQLEHHFVGFNKKLNRLNLVPARDVKVPDFLFRARMSKEMKEELLRGGKVHVDECFYYNAKCSGNIKFDAVREEFIVQDPHYLKPFIAKATKDQLDPQQIKRLENYEIVHVNNFKHDRFGLMETARLRVNPETNRLQFVTAEMERKLQAEQQNAQTAAAPGHYQPAPAQTFEQEPFLPTPDNDVPKQGVGRSM